MFVRGFHDIYPKFVRKFKIMSRLVVVLSDLSFVLRLAVHENSFLC